MTSEESVSIEACIVGAGLLWTLGVALMIWHTLDGPHAAASWALLVSGVAAVWTIVIAMSRCRRRLLAAMSREIALQRLGQAEDSEGLRPVH